MEVVVGVHELNLKNKYNSNFAKNFTFAFESETGAEGEKGA
jgi:hypothetical protein